jgi:hypothetical protein
METINNPKIDENKRLQEGIEKWRDRIDRRMDKEGKYG